MPKTIKGNDYTETRYSFVESYYGASWRIRGTDIDFRGCDNSRSLVPWESILDEPPVIFDRIYKDGTRRIGRKYTDGGPFEDLIWTIRPDGSASYTRSLISMDIIGPIDSYAICSMEAKVTKTLFTPAPGFSTSKYEFSPEGLVLFRKVASLYPNGFTDRSRYNEFPVWQSWDFPFEKDDSKEVKAWIANMHPADVLVLYYTLLEYNGDKQDVYNKSAICRMRKFVSAVTPEEFNKTGFWSPYQEMLIRAIWDIRTDLRRVKDPNTGKEIDGIIDYRLFIMPCMAGSRGLIANAIASLAVGVMTLGASVALQASIVVIDTARSAVATADQNKKVNLMQEFASKVIIGYNAASDTSNIIKPLPFTQRDLSSNPTSYDSQPVDGKQTNTLSLLGILVLGYYLLS